MQFYAEACNVLLKLRNVDVAVNRLQRLWQIWTVKKFELQTSCTLNTRIKLRCDMRLHKIQEEMSTVMVT